MTDPKDTATTETPTGEIPETELDAVTGGVFSPDSGGVSLTIC